MHKKTLSRNSGLRDQTNQVNGGCTCFNLVTLNQQALPDCFYFPLSNKLGTQVTLPGKNLKMKTLVTYMPV